jgi:acetyl esterase/lipase
MASTAKVIHRVHTCALLLVAAVLGTRPGARAQVQNEPSQPATASTQDAGASVKQDVPYGMADGHPLLLDVYLPDAHTDLRPAVVLIHGGGWTSFDKETMSRMASFLARSGFVAFSVDYRLFHGNINLWPSQLDDVQRAVRWIRAHAATYSVDPNHIGAFGHSAGRTVGSLAGDGNNS